MQATKPKFRSDIEGLRAVAVLLVVAYHAGILGCKGGFIGVDVFFVLSGYLITGLLVREVEDTGTISLVEFYARRIRRLLPGSVAMLIGTGIAAMIVFPPCEQMSISASARATFAYLSNQLFIRLSGDYFAADLAANPLLHTWSLAVEEQFYLVWPILFLIVFRLRPSRRFLCLAMAVIGLTSFAAEMWLTKTDQSVAFFLMPARAWEFALGGLASQVRRGWSRERPVAPRVLAWTGIAVIIVSSWVLTPGGFPGAKALLPALGSVLILIAEAEPVSTTIGNLLATRPLQYIGRRSYALYLWHWPILVMSTVLANPLSLKQRVGCIALTFLISEASYRTIENPIRFHRYLQSHATLCVASSMVIMLLGVAATTGWRHWTRHTENFAVYGKALYDLDSPEDAKMGCLVAYGQSVPHECDFGNTASSQSVVLFGDSHMEQWLPAFLEIANRKQWKVVLFVKALCPALAIPVSAVHAEGEDRSCLAWREMAIDRIRELHPAAIVLSNFSAYTEPGGEEPLPLEQWQEGSRRTFAALQGMNVPLVFLRDTPWARYEVTQCLSRYSWDHRHPCRDLERNVALSDGIFDAQKRGAEGMSRVAFIDMSNHICGSAKCPLWERNTIVYRDSNHLTGRYIRSLSTDLYAELEHEVPSLLN